MRRELGAKPYLFPQPVLIIATYDENGNANAMNAAWGGIVGRDEIIIDLSSHKTTDNIMLKKAFTVSIADSDHVAACDFVGLVSGKNVPDKLNKAGFTTSKSTSVDAPIINELPLALECELIKVIDGSKYLARIVNVSADEKILDSNGEVDVEKLKPITYDTAHFFYYALGEKVGHAFKDGNALK